ncbi:MAG: DUF126 domain-containing protein [Acidimicrobiia bacterium]|nr:DUF126 domain-containing protein [Acidimicrobiia bacterium]
MPRHGMFDRLMPGDASGRALKLFEPLSFWGGLDSDTGEIIDRRHPQSGVTVAGTVLVMPSSRGSSSSSSVLAEALRNGTGPVAIVLGVRDPMVVLGAHVARELYEISCPVIVVGQDTMDRIDTGMTVELADETVRIR